MSDCATVFCLHVGFPATDHRRIYLLVLYVEKKKKSPDDPQDINPPTNTYYYYYYIHLEYIQTEDWFWTDMGHDHPSTSPS